MSTRNPSVWTKEWERFSGKPYVKHSPAGTIRETVLEAQDTLTRFGGYCYNQDFWGRDHLYEIQYPQSLGELCLELAQRRIPRTEATIVADTPSFKEWAFRTVPDEGIRRDIQDLRRALYHRNTDPDKAGADELYDWLRWCAWKDSVQPDGKPGTT